MANLRTGTMEERRGAALHPSKPHRYEESRKPSGESEHIDTIAYPKIIFYMLGDLNLSF